MSGRQSYFYGRQNFGHGHGRARRLTFVAPPVSAGGKCPGIDEYDAVGTVDPDWDDLATAELDCVDHIQKTGTV
jgi:hypothetical protein